MGPPGITQESAPTHEIVKNKAMSSKDNVTTAARRAIPQGSAQKAKKEESQKEKETVTRGKAKDRGDGEKEFGKWMEKNLKETGGGISRRRKNQLEVSSLVGRRR